MTKDKRARHVSGSFKDFADIYRSRRTDSVLFKRGQPRINEAKRSTKNMHLLCANTTIFFTFPRMNEYTKKAFFTIAISVFNIILPERVAANSENWRKIEYREAKFNTFLVSYEALVRRSEVSTVVSEKKKG